MIMNFFNKIYPTGKLNNEYSTPTFGVVNHRENEHWPKVCGRYCCHDGGGNDTAVTTIARGLSVCTRTLWTATAAVVLVMAATVVRHQHQLTRWVTPPVVVITCNSISAYTIKEKKNFEFISNGNNGSCNTTALKTKIVIYNNL